MCKFEVVRRFPSEVLLAAFGACTGRGWAKWVRVWRGVRVGCAAAAFGVLWAYRGHGDDQKRAVVMVDAAPHGWVKARAKSKVCQS